MSDALVALGDYVKRGIPGSPVDAIEVAAQEYYMRAAANYRNPTAQYEIGRMMLKDEGASKSRVHQAARWLQLAAEKGHAGAQATLGNLLVPERQGRSRPGDDDGCLAARLSGRPAVDTLHAGRGLCRCR